MCSPPNPIASSQCPHADGVAKAMTPSAMNAMPINGTMRSELAETQRIDGEYFSGDPARQAEVAAGMYR